MRHGRLFRSDSLASLSDTDLRYIVETLSLRTAIDLRAGHEVDDHPHHAVIDAGIRLHHRPIVDETRRREGDASTDLALDDIYYLMLERFGARIATVVELIADADGHPVVFFCAAGKDRTGLVAAMVLSALGVADETVAADYALTSGVLPMLVERNRARSATLGRHAEVHFDNYNEAVLTAEAATMLSVLRRLRAEHSSAESYLRSHGLPAGAVGSLRAGLLV